MTLNNMKMSMCMLSMFLCAVSVANGSAAATKPRRLGHYGQQAHKGHSGNRAAPKHHTRDGHGGDHGMHHTPAPETSAPSWWGGGWYVETPAPHHYKGSKKGGKGSKSGNHHPVDPWYGYPSSKGSYDEYDPWYVHSGGKGSKKGHYVQDPWYDNYHEHINEHGWYGHEHWYQQAHEHGHNDDYYYGPHSGSGHSEDPWYPMPGHDDDYYHHSGSSKGKGGKKGSGYYDDDRMHDDWYGSPSYGKGGKKGGHHPEPCYEDPNFSEDVYYQADQYEYYEPVPGKGAKKHGKKSGGGKGGCYHPPGPTHPPHPDHYTPYPTHDFQTFSPTGSSQPSVSASPTPAPANQITPVPTNANSEVLVLDPYSLAYDPIVDVQPSRQELDEVEEATRNYMSAYMSDRFPVSDVVILEDFVTTLDSSSYVTGTPIVNQYQSMARFSDQSRVIPDLTQLNEIAQQAFIGDNLVAYERYLEENLPAGNVFRGSNVALFDGTFVRVAEPSNGTNGVAIAAGAIAFTLLAAGAVMYKKRMDDEELVGKDLNDKEPTDITVAGETYAGDTYDGTASMYGLSMDEEEGVSAGGRSKQLDDVSVNPAFRLRQMQDDDEDTVEQREVEANRNSVFKSKAPVDDSNREVHAVPTYDSVESGATQERGQSFEEAALQGPSTNLDEKEEDESGEMDEQESPASPQGSGIAPNMSEVSSLKSPSFSELSATSRRPKTVAEIEAMLSSDMDDDVSEAESVREALVYDNVQHPTDRPRTIEEIESLLSAGLSDDASTQS